MCPGPLVEGGRACRAVLAAQAGRAGHVVIGHHRRLHWLQCLVGSVTPARDTSSITFVVIATTGLCRVQQSCVIAVTAVTLTPEYHGQPLGGSVASVLEGWSWTASHLGLLRCSHVAGGANI